MFFPSQSYDSGFYSVFTLANQMVVEYHLFLPIISVVINDFGDFCTRFVGLPRSLSPKLLVLSLAHVLVISLLVMASCYDIFSLFIPPTYLGTI